MTSCWLARFSSVPCEGRLIRAHLIPRQLLRREGHGGMVDDPRTWVWSCGGAMGVGGHHGMLDYSRRLRVPFEALPAGVVEIAEELGLSWWVAREYGPA